MNFVIETSRGTVRSKNVIWAAGEYQYPLEATFEGSEFCRHTATVEAYAGLDGDDYVIIGATKAVLMRRTISQPTAAPCVFSMVLARGVQRPQTQALRSQPIPLNAWKVRRSPTELSCFPTRKSSC